MQHTRWLLGIPISLCSIAAFVMMGTPIASAQQTARIQFFVDPSFTDSGVTLAELGQRLEGYVDDINTIFAKNTSRQFVFDPATDVDVWTDPFPTGGACLPLSPGYSYWVLVQPSDLSVSYNGSAGCNFYDTNAIVLYRFNWKDIWTRAQIAANPSIGSETVQGDYYRRQIHNVVHELGHAHGLGLGEYYNLATVEDRTGIEPQLDIRVSTNPGGTYWGTRSLALNDPMLGNPPSETFLQDQTFSPLGATIINNTAEGVYDPTCPNLDPGFCSPPQVPNLTEENLSVNVEVVDEGTAQPIENCAVTAYYVHTTNYQFAAVATGSTLANGIFTFDWGVDPFSGAPHVHGNNNMARLVKVQCDGYEPNGDWITVFDIQASREMPGGGAADDFHYPGSMTIAMHPLIAANLPPTADAGADQTVVDSDHSGNEIVFLDGSASVDSDGSIVGYVWTEGTTTLGTSAMISTPLAVGSHIITLTVTDDKGAIGQDTMTVTVEDAPINLTFQSLTAKDTNPNGRYTLTAGFSNADIISTTVTAEPHIIDPNGQEVVWAGLSDQTVILAPGEGTTVSWRDRVPSSAPLGTYTARVDLLVNGVVAQSTETIFTMSSRGGGKKSRIKALWKKR